MQRDLYVPVPKRHTNERSYKAGASQAPRVANGPATGNVARDEVSSMRFAYADPPYLGLAEKLYARLHPEAAEYDKPETHQRLIDRLCDEFSDGWAMSLHTPTLRTILPMCPADVRVAAWVKPFASFKPGVNPAYAWEPVIFRTTVKRARHATTVRDWVSCVIALKRGLPGAKPEEFCFWLFNLLGMSPEDEFADLFPGSGGVTRAHDSWKRQLRFA